MSAARSIVGHVMRRSRAITGLGIELVDVAPGRCSVAMRVRDDMLNGQDLCYGGYLFSLCDTASALAVLAGNKLAVTQSANIVYLTAAKLDDRIVASATLSAASRRTVIADVRVVGVDDVLIALFRAQFRLSNNPVLPDAELVSHDGTRT